MSRTFLASSELIGTIVGAGFLGIPYVVSKSGFTSGLIQLIVIGIVITLTMLYLGEIIQRTQSSHQLPGYAERYLGKEGKKLMSFSVSFGIFSAILAYLMAEGESISHLIFNSSQYSLYCALGFWLLLSILLLGGLGTLKKGESIGVILLLIMTISITVLYSSNIDSSNLATFSSSHFFAPLGVILFAFLAFTAMPEVRSILSGERKKMKRVILISYFTAFTIYVIFTIAKARLKYKNLLIL